MNRILGECFNLNLMEIIFINIMYSEEIEKSLFFFNFVFIFNILFVFFKEDSLFLELGQHVRLKDCLS